MSGAPLTRRAAIKALGGAAASLLAGGRLAGRALAQDDDYDPGGRIRVDYDELASYNELLGYPPMLGRVEAYVLRFWGEVTVPTSWQHWEPVLRSPRYYDLAYGCIFRVVDRADDEQGRAWYKLLDDLHPASPWWVQARHVRKLAAEEFTAISPEVPPEAKQIEISIADQTLRCLEYDATVFTTRIASGAFFRDNEGNVHEFNTPYGEHTAVIKMPSRHMIGGEDIDDSYDLPGVPWCTYFTYKGAAIHGTYWHNDFGRPRSHGCVNVTNDAAKWIYRWTTPFAGPEEVARRTTAEEHDQATRITVYP
ncbi:MAG: L,D-transpeptidase [Chloroflexota bacterium]